MTRNGESSLIELVIRAPFRYLGDMSRDMRYALRALSKSPGFALVGIISLGIGMGLTTVIYSSEWKLLSRDLPAAANAKQLAMPEKPVSYYYIEQFRKESAFTGVAAFQNGVPFNITFQGDVNGKAKRVFGQLVSADYFSVLGVEPQRGRVFNPALDQPGNAPVVVISDRFWRERLNASPDAVGQILRLNGQPVTIVGITPKNFNGALAMNPAELFVPITVPATVAPELGNDVLHQHNAKEFMALVRLAPGVSIDSAEAALDTITRRLDEEEDPSAARLADKGRRVTLLSAGTMIPLPRKLKNVAIGFYLVLMGLIMVIACMNLANMLLARGAARQKELAIRLAIGSNRFRLVRQMISEGILLALLGGVAGFGLAYVLSKLNSQFKLPTTIPFESNFTPDWRAAIFVLVLAVLCGIAFSLAPALRATKTSVVQALKEGSAVQLAGYRRFGIRNLLMVVQVMGSLMLLLITGFLVLGISRVSSVQAKFDSHTMYLLSIDPVRDGYTPQKAQALFEKLPEQLRAAAPVRNIALAAQAPFSVDKDRTLQLTVQGQEAASRIQQSVATQTVGAGYFTALSEPMRAGRDFSEQDERTDADGSKPLHVILNESAARQFFGNGNALGGFLKGDKQTYEVSGVVYDLKNGMGDNHPVVYLPLTQHDFAQPPASGITIVIRSEPGKDVLAAIRREMSFIDPNLTIFNVQTLNDYLELSRAYERYDIDTYGGIGVFGLVLSAIGLAGITAYAVAQRRKEIGIRMALGARRGQVSLMVLREGMVLVAIGTFLGFLGAFTLSRALSTLTNVFVDALKIGANSLPLLFGAPLLLAALALLACYLPARRAAKIDPLRALREG